MSDWFVNWFDSPYYQKLYKHRDEEDAAIFLDNLVRTISIPANASILDLCCGKGRHSLYLNKLGYNVLGIDLSSQNIEIANLQQTKGLTFQVGDMRNLSFENHFDLIINLFTSFGYFEKYQENVQVLQKITQALKFNGFFILDFLNAHKIINTITPYCEIQIDDIQYIIRKKAIDNFIVKEIEVWDKSLKYHFEERVYLFEYKDFQDIFKQLGLEIVYVWGDYYGNDLLEKESERLILFGMKR